LVQGGGEGTWIDDLVKALRLHRGSLDKAFGSTSALFLVVLRDQIWTRPVSVPGSGRSIA
jgi:hypothetical protein